MYFLYIGYKVTKTKKCSIITAVQLPYNKDKDCNCKELKSSFFGFPSFEKKKGEKVVKKNKECAWSESKAEEGEDDDDFWWELESSKQE